MNVSLTISFEELCPKCEGRGHSDPNDWENYGRSIPCEYCNGIGTVPTELGKKLLEFLDRRNLLKQDNYLED